MTIHDMYKLSENFFTSLGMDEMTSTFWNTSILAEKPGNMVDCHGSAEDFYKHNDFRYIYYYVNFTYKYLLICIV